MVRGGVTKRVARWVWDRPGAQLVAGAIVVAFAFPATTAGSIALALIAAAVGVSVMMSWSAAPVWLRAPGRLASALVLVAIPLVGLSVFWETLTISPDWQMGDWGPQHAVLASLVPSMPGLDVPVWNQLVSTGDAPLELYPAFTYVVTGHLAIALGLEHDLPLVFMIFATLVHLALATLTTALALRLASRKAALVIGLLWLVDGGAISHGGTVGLFHWAILHSAFAHVFSMIAALGIVAALRRPRLAASLTIWIGTALATATHPAALVMAAACSLALLAVALLADDVPPRRALAALGHVILGLALGAIVWLPAAERLLAYGQHYSNELYTAVGFLQLVMSVAMPMTVYSLIIYAGYLGMIAGVFSRRADVVFISSIACTLLVGLCDVPYLGLGLVPEPETARLGVMRMMLLARPFMYVAAAYALTLISSRVVAGWSAAPARQRMVAAALLGVVGAVFVRVLPSYWGAESQRAYEETRVVAGDRDGRNQLTSWAFVQASGLGPMSWARALFEQHTHEQLHLTARTRLPTLHMGPLPDLLLRERIEDTTPESLARFNVRWAIGVGQSPALGAPESEVTLGDYHIREITAWDGKYARIEKGTGDVIVHRLDDRAVEIEVIGTTEPVLVALGTGFYPRWRARHASGVAEPVYALVATANGSLHVVSAWVAPGRTTFTIDGALPSDGDGRLLAFSAALLALAAVITWSRPRWRIRALRQLARARSRVRNASLWLVRAAAPIVVIALVVRGCAATVAPARAFRVGSGVRGAATVEARLLGGGWVECDYVRLGGEYECDGIVTVSDGTANLMTDAPPSWPFIAPAVHVSAHAPGVEVRITRKLRLAGRYWAMASHAATVALDDEEGREIASKQVIEIDDAERSVRFEAAVPFPTTLKLTFVAEAALEPPRPFLAAPPAEPPAAIRAIAGGTR